MTTRYAHYCAPLYKSGNWDCSRCGVTNESDFTPDTVKDDDPLPHAICKHCSMDTTLSPTVDFVAEMDQK